jgi:hypothetical protein
MRDNGADMVEQQPLEPIRVDMEANGCGGSNWNEKDASPPPQSPCSTEVLVLRVLSCSLAVCCIMLFNGVLFNDMEPGKSSARSGSSWPSWPFSFSTSTDAEPCAASRHLTPIPTLLQRSWVYDELSPAETIYVAQYVVRKLKINATMSGGAATGNALSGTEAVSLIPPTKQHARAFVDGLTDEPPARYAKVVVVRGLEKVPDVMEYRVGPILGCSSLACSDPFIDSSSTITPLIAAASIPYAKRPYDVSDDTIDPACFAALGALKPLLITEFGKIWDFIPG